MTQIENNLDFYFLVDNIYPNQSFSVHISSHTKSIILQNPSDPNFIILKNPSMFREIEIKHWNTNKSKTEHLNKNFEIQTLKFRGIQNRATWVYGERERERGHLQRSELMNWLMSAQVRDELVGGARSLLGWVLLSMDVVTREIMRWTEPLEFYIKAGFQKKSRKWFYVGSEREVGEMSEWGSWVLSNGIWR